MVVRGTMLRRAFSRLLSSLAAVLLIPWLVWRPKTRPGLRARLGFPAALPPSVRSGVRVWVHAASAGDARNIWPVVRLLAQHRTDLRFILTTVTATGEQMAAALEPRPHHHTFLPLDAPGPATRSLKVLRPDVLLLECTELWPWALDAARAAGVTVILCNGRLSARSLPRYQRLFSLWPNPVPLFAALCVQGPDDAVRYQALGAPAQRVVVAGNCKFDSSAAPPDASKVAALHQVLGPAPAWLVAGSTHVGEEDLVLDALEAARSAVPGTRLLWAPRYPDHVPGLLQRVTARGLSGARRSQQNPCANADVVMLDTMGELAAAYALGRVAIVGGSFVPRGGQNILEPAASGVPVLHGPHMHNLPELAQALDGNGALEVSRADLPTQVQRLMSDPEAARAMGATGRAHLQTLSGAAARHLAVVLPLLPPPR